MESESELFKKLLLNQINSKNENFRNKNTTKNECSSSKVNDGASTSFNSSNDNPGESNEPGCRSIKKQNTKNMIDKNVCNLKIMCFRKKSNYLCKLLDPIEENNKKPLYLEASNFFLLVPNIDIEYNYDKLFDVDISKKNNILEECIHNFIIIKEQLRSGDEAFTVIKKCTLCNFSIKEN